jgi:hypothetical protein
MLTSHLHTKYKLAWLKQVHHSKSRTDFVTMLAWTKAPGKAPNPHTTRALKPPLPTSRVMLQGACTQQTTGASRNLPVNPTVHI